MRGDLHVKADYRLVIDNLLDLSHAGYLHANTVGTVGSAGSLQTSDDVGDNRITVLRKVYNLVPSAAPRPVWTRIERIDQQANTTSLAPCRTCCSISASCRPMQRSKTACTSRARIC